MAKVRVPTTDLRHKSVGLVTGLAVAIFYIHEMNRAQTRNHCHDDNSVDIITCED